MFTQGFLGAGGYDLQEAVVANAEELAKLLVARSPAIVVLCSEDAAYLDFARALKASVPIVVAGNPVDVIEDLKAAGVDDFIHIRLDQLETLERFHAKFGIPEIPLDEPLIPEAK
jgi:methylmalonyl-CoA mutase